MKKLVWLLVLTVMCVGGIGYVGMRSRPQTVVLKTKTLSAAAAFETVSCKGRVEKTDTTAVQPVADCIVDEVLVQNGDKVKKGDVLFTVDTAATLSALASTDSTAAVKTAMSNTLLPTVTAPCDGVVSNMSAQSGALLNGAEACAVITANEPVQIRLSVPERNIARVAVGQEVAVSGIGFSQNRYSGYISEIASVAKQEVNGTATQTTVEAVVTLDDGQSDDSLRVGLTAKGAITVSTVPLGFILPYDAVTADEENREFVYVLQGDRAEKRLFTPLAELGDGYLVTEGFANGEQLILEPDKVTANSVFQAKEAADA